MTKNGIVLSIVAVILGVCYVCFFTGWFKTETIQIIPTIRANRPTAAPRNPDQEPVYPVSFALDDKYMLTSVKVVAAGDMATNNYPTPLWHLISDSNSIPVKSLVYGYPIKGMKPAVARARPEPLEPDVEYVLLLEAGKVKARTNFHTARVAQP
jgi:hypothetical protein